MNKSGLQLGDSIATTGAPGRAASTAQKTAAGRTASMRSRIGANSDLAQARELGFGVEPISALRERVVPPRRRQAGRGTPALDPCCLLQRRWVE